MHILTVKLTTKCGLKQSMHVQYLKAHSLLVEMGLLDDMNARDFWTVFILRLSECFH